MDLVGRWIALLLAPGLLLCGCGGDAEKELHELPRELAESLREGDTGAVLDALAADFSAHGHSKEEIRALLPRWIDVGREQVLVARTDADPEETAEGLRRLLVIGLLSEGDPARVTLRALRPFRIELELRRKDDRWEIVRATASR